MAWDCLGWDSDGQFAIMRWSQGDTMKEQLTAVYQKVQEGYIAFVEELPGANSQGQTLDEARADLREAIHSS